MHEGRRIPIIRGGMPIGDTLPTRLAEWAGVGTTYYVDAATGSDSNTETQAKSESTPWLTIQKAIDDYIKPATGHVRIFVKNGTYRKAGGTNATNATVNFFGQSTNAGDATHVIHLLAYPGHTPVVEEATYTGGSPTISERHSFWFDDANSKFVRVRGFEVRPNGASVALNQAQGFRIDGVVADIEIDQCHIHGWKVSGGGTQPRAQGIFIENGSTRVHLYNLHIHDNGDTGTGGFANLEHGMYVGGSNHVIVNCLTYDMRNGFGVQFYEGGGGGTGHIISHLVTANNKKSGIVVDGTFTVDIRNSIFYDNDEWGVSSRGSATVTVRYCISNGNLAGDEGDGYNTEGTSTITRSNNLTSDPSFVNYASRDFHLNTGSPAYNVGLIEYTPLTDFAGTARLTSTLGVYTAPEETIAFPTTSVLDNANRTSEGPPPSASWSNSDSTDGIRVASTSNFAGGTGQDYSVWNTVFNADQEVYIDLTTLVDTRWTDLLLRHNGTTTSYVVRHIWSSAGNDIVRVYRRIAGVDTQIGADMAGTEWVNGDSFGVAISGTGSTVTISIYRKPSAGAWGTVGVVIDTNAARIVSSGRIGLGIDSTTTRVDNFGGGSLTAGTTYTDAATVLLKLTPSGSDTYTPAGGTVYTDAATVQVNTYA